MIASIEAEYRRYKALGEAAIAQLADAELSMAGPKDGNSVAALVWHIGGSLQSRFTDFRTTDGEKPWRNRDDEFARRTVTRTELLDRWKAGWRALFDALGQLEDGDAGQTITIRGQPLRIDQALHRSLAHTAYHVGQLVYVAKALRGADWHCLSIPLGASEVYNRSPVNELAAAHAATLASVVASRVENVTIVAVPVASAEAQLLMAEADAELRQRYPGEPTNGLQHRDIEDPNTVYVVARIQGELAGGGASRRLDPAAAEIKRMFVRPSFRGRGIGRRILMVLEAMAKEAGVRLIRLEAGIRQPEAMGLYKSSGFAAIEPYGEFIGNPLSRCFEKHLAGHQPDSNVRLSDRTETDHT